MRNFFFFCRVNSSYIVQKKKKKTPCMYTSDEEGWVQGEVGASELKLHSRRGTMKHLISHDQAAAVSRILPQWLELQSGRFALKTCVKEHSAPRN
jgi:hypothetical protein